MEKLDARLRAAARFVRKGTVAADIGTDHAYLICYLIEKKICVRGYACDINEGPLENARAEIESRGLSDRITLVHADGLEKLPERGIDEVILCGMGGETIAGILEKGAWVKRETVHLIMQAMTRPEYLRKWLCEHGFRINAEAAAEAEGHVYSVMSAYYSGEKWTPDQLYCYIGELPGDPSKSAEKYLRRQAAIQRAIARGLERSPNGAQSAVWHDSLADMIEEQIWEQRGENKDV